MPTPFVIEIVSPGDETYAKLDFYARHGVEEILIVDPGRRVVEWLALAGGGYQAAGQSRVIEAGPEALAERISWA